jgi:hypothetical protein
LFFQTWKRNKIENFRGNILFRKILMINKFKFFGDKRNFL